MSDQATGLAQVEEPKRPKWTDQDAKDAGLPSPGALNFMVAVAEHLAASALYTPDMGDTPQKVKANALAKMLTGREMGLQPLEAMRTLHVVKGRIGLPYDLMISRMLEQGTKIEWLQDTAEGCRVRGTRADGLMSYEAFFGPDDAKRAGLASSDNYVKRPQVMYRARAVSQLYRIIGGRSAAKTYTPEEIRDIEDENGHAAPTPASIDRAAGTDQTVKIDPAIIPEEAESVLKEAAHRASVTQGWVAAKLIEIQAKVLSDWIHTPEAKAKDLAGPLLTEALKELEAIAAQKAAANGGKPEKPGRGRPRKTTALEQAVAALPGPTANPDTSTGSGANQPADFPDPLA